MPLPFEPDSTDVITAEEKKNQKDYRVKTVILLYNAVLFIVIAYFTSRLIDTPLT